TIEEPVAVVEAIAVVRTAIESARRIERASEAVIPRAGADEDSVHKPGRTIVSVGRTVIRVVRIVAVRANWRTGNIAGADTETDSNSDLRLRKRKRHEQRCDQSEIFQVFHNDPFLDPRFADCDCRIFEVASEFSIRITY